MLSIANVGGGQEAGKYYEKADDYYTQDQSPSEWQGKGAEVLGLSGEVSIGDFEKLLDGNLPNGEMIQVAASGHRGGTDLTFSAPKSISMQALIGEDPRLIEAHQKAVQEALKYAEGLSAYRKMEDKEISKVQSNNFVAATFRHELSRACDPQIHTHCVVLNMTQREDGKWRAMDNEEMYRQKMLLGAYYRAELAREVQELGYGIRVTHADGRFELAHIQDKQIEKFCQRSQAIEEALKKEGKTRSEASSQEKSILTIATRPKKTDVDRQVLKEYWQEKSKEAQIDYKIPSPQKSYESRSAAKTVGFALDHLTERQAVIKEAQIVKEALQHGTGTNTYSEIKAEMKRRVDVGLLIRSNDRYTTPQAIEREKKILQIEKRGRGITEQVLGEAEVFKKLENTKLNEGQKKSAELILISKNRIVGVQGLAGTGKTFMLKKVRELAEKEGYQMIGLAPSAAAAGELLKTGIQSQTLASFEAQKEKRLSSKSILVIDEAGMVSAKQMESILKTAEKHYAKIVLIGDTQQLKAVEAGKPFAQLQAHGMQTAGMSQVQRQKNPNLKKAVELAAAGQVRASVALMEKSVTEIQNPQQRYAQIAKDYVLLSKIERDQTLIVSGTNKARKTINDSVRDQLGLSGKGQKIETLERKNLTQAQIKQIKNYRVGDFMKPHRDYKSLGLKKGELAQIKEIKALYIVIEKPDGSVAKWKPHQKNKVSVYASQVKEMSPGESVRITENDRKQGLVNGERGKIIGIDENQKLHIQQEDGKTFKLDASKPLHLDYGYCSTVHAAQGKTCSRVLIEADTKSLTSSRDNYYVAISRARQEARIYTNDRGKLPDVMGRENRKENALEINRI